MPKNQAPHTRPLHGGTDRFRPTVHLYPVYAHRAGSPEPEPNETPLFFLNKIERNQYLDLRFATSHCRGSVLRLCLLLPPRPQPSVTLTGVADGVVSNKSYALACLNAWKPGDRHTDPRWPVYGRHAQALQNAGLAPGAAAC